MLTGLGNRRAFFDTARRAVMSAAAQTWHAVLYIDIDHFKSINDRYGHDAGDAVLKYLAEQLRACTRPDDFVARIGGEEFAVHVVRIQPAGLAAIAQGVLTRSAPMLCALAVIPFAIPRASAARSAPPALPIDKLLSLADKELCAGQARGRDGTLPSMRAGRRFA